MNLFIVASNCHKCNLNLTIWSARETRAIIDFVDYRHMQQQALFALHFPKNLGLDSWNRFFVLDELNPMPFLVPEIAQIVKSWWVRGRIHGDGSDLS